MATTPTRIAATSLKELARFTESLSFLYVEHAVIEREHSSVAAFTAAGRVSIPAATLSALMLDTMVARVIAGGRSPES
jgi:CRISPR-associated protein Cas1